MADQIAEDVRVAVDELVDDAGDDVVDRKASLAARQLGLEDDLEQQVPQLLAQGLAVARVDGVDDLAGLLEDVLAQGLEGLLAVPGAAVGSEQPAHHPHEAREGRAVLKLEGGTGRGSSSSKRGKASGRWAGARGPTAESVGWMGFASGMAGGKVQ